MTIRSIVDGSIDRDYAKSIFERHFDKGKDDECWEWKSATISKGYGVFVAGRESMYAHRFSLMLTEGPPTKEASFACHTCDNPSCVNPSHLYWGNAKTNMADAMDRNRITHGGKLSAKDIEHIRTTYLSNQSCSVKSLANKYSVSRSLIADCIRLKIYKDHYTPDDTPTYLAAAERKMRQSGALARKELTDDEIEYIKLNKDKGRDALAKMFSVSTRTISKKWK